MTFASGRRGLRIAGTDFVYLNEGAYGVIFVDRERRRIRKLYRVRHDADLAHCREVFTAETGAYDVASSHPELSTLIPGYFGTCQAGVIVDRANSDVTKEFHSGLAFEAEFVECPFYKIGSSEVPPIEHQRVTALFHHCGIDHLIDASVCLRDGAIRKVIDFAMKDIPLRW